MNANNSTVLNTHIGRRPVARAFRPLPMRQLSMFGPVLERLESAMIVVVLLAQSTVLVSIFGVAAAALG